MGRTTTSPTLNEDFRDALAALLKAEARFLVVGAHALAVHGAPRATLDLDVWVEPTKENARRVWHALAQFGAPLDALNIRESSFVLPDMVTQIGLPPRRIDLLTGVSGLEFKEAWKDRLEVAIDGLSLPFIGRDSLIRNKRASGRQKDLGDLEMLGVV